VQTKILRMVAVPQSAGENTRSTPVEGVGTVPAVPVVSSAPLEYPQQMTMTAGLAIPPMRPTSDSTLALR